MIHFINVDFSVILVVTFYMVRLVAARLVSLIKQNAREQCSVEPKREMTNLKSAYRFLTLLFKVLDIA